MSAFDPHAEPAAHASATDVVGETGKLEASPAPLPDPLRARAPKPKAIRVRPAAIQLIAGAGVVVMAGALTWVFVIGPQVEARSASSRADDGRPAPPTSKGAGEVLGHGPRTYGDLAAADPTTETPPPPPVPVEPAPAASPAYASAASAPAPGPRAPSPALEAARSALFIEGGPVKGGSASLEHTTQPAQVMNTTTGVAGQSLVRKADYAAVYGDRAVLAPLSPYELKAGTRLPAALETAVSTERPGRVVAVLTAPVHDTVTGKHVLVPAGSRLLGRHDADQIHGDKRVYLVWERLLFPDGRSLTLGEEPGLDIDGGTGIAGRVDRRIGQIAVASLLAGAVTTLGENARREGTKQSSSLLGDAGDAAALEASRVGGRIIDRELEVRPVITLPPGTRVQVLLTRDLIVEPAP